MNDPFYGITTLTLGKILCRIDEVVDKLVTIRWVSVDIHKTLQPSQKRFVATAAIVRWVVVRIDQDLLGMPSPITTLLGMSKSLSKFGPILVVIIPGNEAYDERWQLAWLLLAWEEFVEYTYFYTFRRIIEQSQQQYLLSLLEWGGNEWKYQRW